MGFDVVDDPRDAPVAHVGRRRGEPVVARGGEQFGKQREERRVHRQRGRLPPLIGGMPQPVDTQRSPRDAAERASERVESQGKQSVPVELLAQRILGHRNCPHMEGRQTEAAFGA